MKRRILLLFIGCLVVGSEVLGVRAQAIPTLTPTPTPPASEIIAEDVIVRGGPGRDYPRIGQLTAGRYVFPVSRNEAGDWVMIRYYRGFGWVQRDLAFWVEDIDALPVIGERDLTPSPIPGTDTPTPFFLTATPTGNWVWTDARSLYVRAGPGRLYLRLGDIFPGDQVEPVARSADATWILIRFADGFGWIVRDAVRWAENVDELPVVSPDDLTPTATFTASFTPTATSTATLTDTPTLTETPRPSDTPTPTETPTLTETPRPSDTPEPTATDTPTSRPVETQIEPVILPGVTLTDTPAPSDTPAPTLTDTPRPSDTPTATSTDTPVPTATDTPTPSDTPTATSTDTPVPTATVTPTHTLRPSDTPVPTATDTLAPSDTPTPTAAAPVVLPTEGAPPQTVTPPGEGGGLPLEAVVGGAGLLLVLAYAGLYWLGLRDLERYAGGFVVSRCPVCGRGDLTVETRPERFLGIPRGRRIVRCTECRSVLREVGSRRWRYAVDPIENPALYRQFNGREIDEETLAGLAKSAASAAPPRPTTPPVFFEDDDL
ncbi:MAG: hypothetical protein BroJett038_08410 [Chloroflexota bacterium]|nr:MAG: hypothetical protein BroJett038_08410 [Chloroflexota bacterium]